MTSDPTAAPDRTTTGKTTANGRRPGGILMISLALNVFFLGAAGTLVARYYTERCCLPSSSHKERAGDHSPAKRIEALAARLPHDDAAILRSEFNRLSPTVEAARETVRIGKDAIRRALQAEPFDAAAMKTAMADSRASREAFMEALHDVIATSAAKMSPAGRRALAEFATGEHHRSNAGRDAGDK